MDNNSVVIGNFKPYNYQLSFNIQKRRLSFDPLSINFHTNGEMYVLSGTNRKASLYTKEGGFLIDICDKKDWIWCAKIKPREMYAACTTNDGDISLFKVTPLTVHAIYQDRYAYRDSLTDIVV